MLTHEQYMQIALTLARRGLGRTWPNPTVGCVIVKNGVIIARARTSNGGRPHAEALALEKCDAQGATVYVTLEPCAHYGKTPPCAESLLKARVGEVFVGCTDPDARVAGKGIEILREAGIEVTNNLLEKKCRDLNAGFFKSVEKGLPFVTLKAAISADGKYLPGDGKPRWVTGELARNYGQLLRSQHDAIITGTGTVLADNPRLDCRLPGMNEFSPVKIVIGNTPISKSAHIFEGKEVWHYERNKLRKILQLLGDKGVTRVMVEAGPKLSEAFLMEGLLDEVVIFESAVKLGVQGVDFFEKNALINFVKISEREVGDDKIIRFKLKF